MRRPTETAFEIVIDARPYGPPLSSAEQLLRFALAAVFVSFLAAEAWLLWHVWSLWA